MGVPRSKQSNLKRLNDQAKKHSKNPKMVERLNKRISVLDKSKG